MSTAIFIVILVIIVAVLLYFFMSSKSSLSSTVSATTMQTIAPSSLPSNSNPVNFAYSIWFYVNDWQYKYGDTKIIFGRMSTNGTTSSTTNMTYEEILDNSPCPVVTLGQYQNDISILLDQTSTGSAPTTEVEPVVVTNIPLQKWVNLVMSVYGKTMDVYIDGKLVQTVVLIGPANVNTTQNVYVTPCGGFNGWTSNLQYFPNPLNPQQVWSIYQKGYGSGYLANLFNAYELTVTLNNNGVPTKTFSI